MKRIKFATLAVALFTTTIFSSCNKEDAIDANANTSASLTAGRAGIVFNSNANFVTGNTFNVKNTGQTIAQSVISGSNRIITLTAVEMTSSNSVDSRSAIVSILLPGNSSTAQGSLVSDLSLPSSETRIAHITLTSNTGTTAGTTFNSETGTLTITKLTETEIEGTFNATVNDGGTNAMVLSNGSFAGKF